MPPRHWFDGINLCGTKKEMVQLNYPRKQAGGGFNSAPEARCNCSDHYAGPWTRVESAIPLQPDAARAHERAAR